MKNPFAKILGIHLFFTGTCFLPLMVVPFIGHLAYYTVSAFLMLFMGNLWLKPFLVNHLFKYDVAKWKFEKEVDFKNWTNEKELENHLKIEMIKELHELELKNQKELLNVC